MLGISLKKIISEGAWVAGGLILNSLLLLLGTRLLTTFLPAGEYGRLALGLSLVGIVVQVGATPISQAALRFYFALSTKGGRSDFFNQIFFYLGMLILLVVLLATLVGFGLSVNGSNKDVLFVILVALWAILMSVNRLAIAIQDALRRRALRAIMQSSLELGRFALAILIMVWALEPTAEAAMAGFILAGLAIIGMYIYKFNILYSDCRFSFRFKHDATGLEDKLGFKRHILPLIVSNSCIWSIMMMDKWLIQLFYGLDIVGGYAAAYQLTYIPMMMVGSCMVILTTPIIFKMLGEQADEEKAAKATRINRYMACVIFVITLFLSLLLFYYHSAFARVLLGEEYRIHSWIFPWLALAGGCFASAQQLLLKLTFQMQFSLLALIWSILAILSVLAYYAGLQIGGLEGLVWTMAGVSLLLLLISLLISFKTDKVTLIEGNNQC